MRGWRADAVACLLVAVAVAALLLPRVAGWPVARPSVLDVASVAPLLLVGAYLSVRRLGGAVGWLLLVGGVMQVFSGALLPDVHGRVTHSPVAQWLGLIATACYNQMFVVLALAALLFPDGRLHARWGRYSAAAALAASVLFLLVIPVPWREITVLHPLRNPVGAAAWAPLGGLFYVAVVLVGITGVGGLAALVARWRSADALTRARLAWAVWAVGVSTAVLATGLIYALVTHTASGFWLDVATGNTFQILVPIAIGIAMTRGHLYGIDVVVNRTISYAIVAATLGGLYVAVVAGVSRLTRAPLPSVLAAALVAVAFAPLRTGVQRLINRRLFGYGAEPYKAIEDLSGRMARQLVPALVPTTIVESVASALRLPYAALAVPRDGAYTVIATVGVGTGTPLVLDLPYQGEIVGRLLVSPRSSKENFRPHELRLLNELARHAGIAVSAARLTTDLQRSRARLAAAREEERRRIWRELHDGLGPTLAGVSFGMEAARNQVPDGAPVAELLNTLAAQLLDAIADVRRIVHDLRPTALDQLGLEGALQLWSRTVPPSDGLEISIECSGLPTDLPPLVEAAAYRIATEGLTNVARHARAHRATVQLSADQTDLSVEVVDDGCGITAAQTAGGGLVTMRQRAAELGGSCSIGPAPAGAGTQIRAVLPTRQP